MTDSEGDILTGRCLDEGEQITEGTRLTIDVFDVWVVDYVQGSSISENQIEIMDLTSEPKSAKPEPRIGGSLGPGR